MAIFSRFNEAKIDAPTLYSLFSNNTYQSSVDWYKVEGQITEEDVKKINQLSNYTILIIKNTKDQNSQILKKITSSKVKFSVVGGLDYINKKKFNDSEYILRTIYSPHILTKIIEYFEKIEKTIRYTWSDSQKCMYIYKQLTEDLHYKYDEESDYENGRDVVRTLEGLLYGKLVCSGFALAFKEAMDRIGIPCLYQNRQHHHSWNLVKLGKKIIGVELTWDCYNKEADNKCRFVFFGNDSNFYDNKHHDISGEAEEKRYELSEISNEELQRDLNQIKYNGNIRKEEMKQGTDSLGIKVYYLIFKEDDKYNYYFIQHNNKCDFVILDKTQKLEDILKLRTINSLIVQSLKNQEYIKFQLDKQVFRRSDGSEFIIKDNKKSKNGVNEFYYYDVVAIGDKRVLSRYVILSEMNLLYADNGIIANSLLSRERLARKINYYHGYVGYINQRGQMLYNRDFEQEHLGIKNRK